MFVLSNYCDFSGTFCLNNLDTLFSYIYAPFLWKIFILHKNLKKVICESLDIQIQDNSILKSITQWAPKHYTLNNRNVHALFWIIFLSAYETVSFHSLFPHSDKSTDILRFFNFVAISCQSDFEFSDAKILSFCPIFMNEF
jgi:hypothetical protein